MKIMGVGSVVKSGVRIKGIRIRISQVMLSHCFWVHPHRWFLNTQTAIYFIYLYIFILFYVYL